MKLTGRSRLTVVALAVTTLFVASAMRLLSGTRVLLGGQGGDRVIAARLRLGSLCLWLLAVAACAVPAQPSPQPTQAGPLAGAAATSTPRALASPGTAAPPSPSTPAPTVTSGAPVTTTPATTAPTTTAPTRTSPPAATVTPTPAYPHTISGRVTSGGAAVAGVRVQIAGDLRVSVTTGDDGRYQASVPNGTFGIFFDPPAPLVAEWHLNAASSFEATPVRVSGATVVIDADLARGATLSGTVRCGGAGAPNAVVLAMIIGGPSYRGTTDASGQYRLGVPTGEKYLIAAEPPTTSGCVLAFAGTNAYYAAAGEAVAVGGDTKRDIVLPAGRRLAGRVTRADGSPAVGATVSVWAADPFEQPVSPGRQLYQVNEVGTDADGRFDMLLPPMSLRFYVASGSELTWWNGKASWSTATPVDMSTGDKTLDIRLAAR